MIQKMKRLLLTRHAKSSWDHPELRDVDRPLNNRGLKDAPKIGKALKRLNLLPDAILISPSKRTRMTAQLLAQELNFIPEEIEVIESFYGATPEEVVYQVRQISDEIDTAMLIGHNPTWTMLCQHLTREFLHNLPTCGVIEIEFETNHWISFDDRPGKLIKILKPKEVS